MHPLASPQHQQQNQQDFERDLPQPLRRSQQMRRTTSRICGRPILMAELQNSPREVK
jgi:hypothetical protein